MIGSHRSERLVYPLVIIVVIHSEEDIFVDIFEG